LPLVSSLRRRLNAFDLTLITIGAIVGSGIFRNPALVAAQARAPWLILGCWIVGGLLALIGAYIYAELGSRHPVNGGTYAFLRDAFHPGVAFVFGWTLLLVADTGGTAASAVLFSNYLQPLTGLTLDSRLVAAITLTLLTAINCLGVRQGGTWQNVLVVCKVAALGALIVAGFIAHPLSAGTALPAFSNTGTLIAAFGVAMLPVLFAYNGFQGTSYVTGEAIDPQRTVPRGLIVGITAVIAIYVLVSFVCLRVLGPAGLAASKTPAADVMQAVAGPLGARFIAFAIALSTLGFMSTRLLVAPRVYFQMADDGLFFKWLGWINPRTGVPTFAIIAEGLVALIIAVSGTFEHIVNWVAGPEWLFVIAVAVAIFVFRKRKIGTPVVRVPFHPYSTGLLIVVLVGILIAEFVQLPLDSLYGVLVILSGAVFYTIWNRVARRA
jgi:APA family basic amino acid/polyamine antiporter